jgi:hypothetical protein
MLFAVLALLLTVPNPPPMESAGKSAGAEQRTEQPKKVKKVCKVLEAETGSRLGGRKVCRTAEEWKKED